MRSFFFQKMKRVPLLTVRRVNGWKFKKKTKMWKKSNAKKIESRVVRTLRKAAKYSATKIRWALSNFVSFLSFFVLLFTTLKIKEFDLVMVNASCHWPGFPPVFFFGVSMATFELILFDIFRRSHGSSSNGGGGGHLWLIPFVGRRLRRRPIKKNVEMFFFGRIQQTIDSLSVEWTVTFLNKIELFHK